VTGGPKDHNARKQPTLNTEYTATAGKAGVPGNGKIAAAEAIGMLPPLSHQLPPSYEALRRTQRA